MAGTLPAAGHPEARPNDMRLAVLTLVLALAACSGGRSVLPNDPRELPELLDPPPNARDDRQTGPTYIARLRPLGGSMAQGAVMIAQHANGAVVTLDLQNVTPGMYTWALHERGNCSSANGFSAGAPWAPAGTKKFPVDLLPEFVVSSDSPVNVTARIRGARIVGDGGVAGRAVLIYEGASIKPIKAGEPNNVVACGVFDTAKSLF